MGGFNDKGDPETFSDTYRKSDTTIGQSMWDINNEKKIQILEITKKTKFSSRKPEIWEQPVGLKFARRQILLTNYERGCI